MPYDPALVRPMREEVTRLGARELHTVADVDDAIQFAQAAPYPSLADGAGPVYADIETTDNGQ